MAWFSYHCSEHGDFKISLPKRQKKALCPICSRESDGIMKIGSVQVKERLDNGLMGRAVERLSNIEEIVRERSEKFKVKQEADDDEG